MRLIALLVALEVRLALLVEGAHALAAVGGVHQPVVGLDLEAIAAEEIHAEPVVDGFFRLAHGERAVAGDRRRGLAGFLDQVARLADAVYESPIEALAGAERPGP